VSIPRKRVDWRAYDQFVGSDADFARSIGMEPSNFHQYKKTRWRDEPTFTELPVETVDLTTPDNGNLPAIPSVHSSAPERISALPVHYDASEVDNLRGRVATLEAFMAAIESQQRPSAPQRIDSAPAHSDTLERIHEALAQLDTRLHVVEASPQLSALPAHSDAPAHHSAPERTEPPTWKSQGQQFAEDTLQRLDHYARQSRREKREIIDAALRAYLPPEVGEEAHDA
jgi:hypothetical protein